MYVAIYRLPVSPDGDGITFPGLLYAMKAGAMEFASFRAPIEPSMPDGTSQRPLLRTVWQRRRLCTYICRR